MRIEVSDRIKRLPPYISGELNALKLKLRREGKDIIDLGWAILINLHLKKL